MNYIAFDRMVGGNLQICRGLVSKGIDRSTNRFLATATIPYTFQPDGLPIQAEWDRLSFLEDKLTNEIAPYGSILLGRLCALGKCSITYACTCQPPQVVKLKIGFLRSELCRLEVVEDPNWTWFNLNLAPTSLEEHRFNNRSKLERMSATGTKNWIFSFAAVFQSPDQLQVFAEQVGNAGYRVVNSEQARATVLAAREVDFWVEEEMEGGYWCEFSRVMGLQEESLATLCAELDKQINICGGQYGGWGCAPRS